YSSLPVRDLYSFPTRRSSDLFGFCVDLSSDGNTLAICGFDEDGGVAGINGNEADNSKNGSGCAYIFVRDGATWKQTTYFKQSNRSEEHTSELHSRSDLVCRLL